MRCVGLFNVHAVIFKFISFFHVRLTNHMGQLFEFSVTYVIIINVTYNLDYFNVGCSTTMVFAIIVISMKACAFILPWY